MGCAISGLAESADLGEKSVHQDGAHLSQDDIDMIKESWKVIRDDIAKVGIIVFVRLFETHPECKDVFFLFRDVKDLERLRTSNQLRAHGLRVMSFIEKSVARLDQLERLEALAVELGKSHYHYNAPPKYYSYVGAEFISAVQPILKDNWTTELEEAWKTDMWYLKDNSNRVLCIFAALLWYMVAIDLFTLFQYVTGLMKQGYEEECERQHQAAVSPKERADKRNTAL